MNVKKKGRPGKKIGNDCCKGLWERQLKQVMKVYKREKHSTSDKSEMKNAGRKAISARLRWIAGGW